jgi:hypothetical protein
MTAIVVGVIFLERSGGIAQGHGKPFIFGGWVAVILPFCFLAYKRGGYAVRA